MWVALAVLFLGIVLVEFRRRRAKQEVKPEAQVEPDWKSLFQEEERKRLEVLGAVDGILEERNSFRKLWWQCSMEHGNAQRFMVDEIRRCYRLLSKNKIAIRERTDVLALADSYQATYSPEKLAEERGRIERSRGALQAEFEDKSVAEKPPNA